MEQAHPHPTAHGKGAPASAQAASMEPVGSVLTQMRIKTARAQIHVHSLPLALPRAKSVQTAASVWMRRILECADVSVLKARCLFVCAHRGQHFLSVALSISNIFAHSLVVAELPCNGRIWSVERTVGLGNRRCMPPSRRPLRHSSVLLQRQCSGRVCHSLNVCV